MKTILMVIGGYTVIKTIYETGKVVGEIQCAAREVKMIRKEFKEKMREQRLERIAKA